MKRVAVTQNVVVDARGTRLDTLDQRWYPFFAACDLVPIALPNCVETSLQLLRHIDVDGFVLTGGNDLVACGGSERERDVLETTLLRKSLGEGVPLVGVCRGMQLIQHEFSIALKRVSGQAGTEVAVVFADAVQMLPSYHNWGTVETVPALKVWAASEGGVVKAIRHETAPVVGIMWHPERMQPTRAQDAALFRSHFGNAA